MKFSFTFWLLTLNYCGLITGRPQTPFYHYVPRYQERKFFPFNVFGSNIQSTSAVILNRVQILETIIDQLTVSDARNEAFQIEQSVANVGFTAADIVLKDEIEALKDTKTALENQINDLETVVNENISSLALNLRENIDKIHPACPDAAGEDAKYIAEYSLCYSVENPEPEIGLDAARLACHNKGGILAQPPVDPSFLTNIKTDEALGATINTLGTKDLIVGLRRTAELAADDGTAIFEFLNGLQIDSSAANIIFAPASTPDEEDPILDDSVTDEQIVQINTPDGTLWNRRLDTAATGPYLCQYSVGTNIN